MGPLVPQELIGDNWNFVIAFITGIFFGFILESAGFSSSRKLVGVFYGYDFVVLRVFFTAAITAMIGMLFFHYFGWMDISMVYVNPTYVSSAIIGGVVMGLGFIIGGFCPGTSVCAAAIGKIDAMFFLVGIFIGIFFFAETYAWFQDLHLANNLGGIKVYESLGLEQGVFALLLIVVAIIAFVVTSMIEKKVTKVDY